MATIHGIEGAPDELRALALTGYGHFTSMHVEEGAVRGFDLHMERLISNANASSTPISTEGLSWRASVPRSLTRQGAAPCG